MNNTIKFVTIYIKNFKIGFKFFKETEVYKITDEVIIFNIIHKRLIIYEVDKTMYFRVNDIYYIFKNFNCDMSMFINKFLVREVISRKVCYKLKNIIYRKHRDLLNDESFIENSKNDLENLFLTKEGLRYLLNICRNENNKIMRTSFAKQYNIYMNIRDYVKTPPKEYYIFKIMSVLDKLDDENLNKFCKTNYEINFTFLYCGRSHNFDICFNNCKLIVLINNQKQDVIYKQKYLLAIDKLKYFVLIYTPKVHSYLQFIQIIKNYLYIYNKTITIKNRINELNKKLLVNQNLTI